MAAKTHLDSTKVVVLAVALGGTLVAVSLCAYGVRWSPAELDVSQSPGTEATYVLTLYNDGEQPAELQIYVWDWVRTVEGQNDLGIAPNGVRWLDRATAGGVSPALARAGARELLAYVQSRRSSGPRSHSPSIPRGASSRVCAIATWPTTC